ncbi:MAG: TetR family transcriptional regulator [Bacteroidetes bacterium]|nr:TetR family transcriptional regulator [Bacteroidota bacterium]
MATAVLSTKQNIRQAAQRLFRDRGYASVGMRELAKKVGIEAPSIYNHYKSKDDILREICFEIGEQFFKAVDSINTNEKSVKVLRAYIKAHIGVMANNMEASNVFFHEWMFLEEPNLGKFKKMRQQYEQKYREVIDKGIKKGDLKPLNTRLIILTIFSAINSTYDLYKSSEKLSQEEIAEQITDLLLKGLKS